MKSIQIYEQFLDTQAAATRTAQALVKTYGKESCQRNLDSMVGELHLPKEMPDLFVKRVREYIQSL